MKIAYFVNEITGLGGVRRVVIVKANSLAERGYDVSIIARNHKPDAFMITPINPKVKIVQVSLKPSNIKNFYIRFITDQLRLRKWLKNYIKVQQPDILINVGHSGRMVMNTLSHRKTKYIQEIHLNSRAQLIENKRGLKHCLNWCKLYLSNKLLGHRWDRIVLLTESDYNNDWIGTKDNTIVIPNPITITPKPSKLIEKVVISVGRLDAQKNFQQLIRAFSIVKKKHSDWQLKIFGDGPEHDTLLDLIDSLHLNEIVRLMGTSNNIPHELSMASIFVLTSMHEGFCLAAIEALSCGLPVIANKVPGLTEIIDKQGCGFLVQFNNINETADRICKLIESYELRKKMSQEAYRRANDFELSKVIDKWDELFHQVMIE